MKTLSSLCCLLALCAPAAFAADSAASQPEAHVTKNGDTVELDTQFSVPVSREIAWAVLTDFEHMTAFIPNLASSKVLEKKRQCVEGGTDRQSQRRLVPC